MTDTGSQATRAAWTAWLGGSCEVCHGWCRARLCTHCRLQFASPRPRCLCCGLGLPDGVQRCGACLTDPPLFERCICSVDYAFPWDRLITRFKFKHAPELATVLVEGLVESARQTHAPAPEAFVPVPLSNERLAERGYDQAWELARRLGRALKRPAHARAIVRRFDARHQVQLSRRERLANLQGAFAVPPAQRPRVQGLHIGLVDDVMTTGATAHEAAAALQAAGAARIDLWVVARTPAPGDAD